ncbi:MAG: hypothetical protein GWP08_20045 [Nitrospiraceae bacterium]|nr:hypothetical protein [Nitrospiraceae bacterium]
MSGAYLLQDTHTSLDAPALAALLSAQLVRGGETTNHYAAEHHTLLGGVSPSAHGPGASPRYIPSQRIWALMLGSLYESEIRTDWRRQNPQAPEDLDLFAAFYRQERLLDALPAMNGAFFVLLWDLDTGDVIAANDRFGLYPMYWAHQQGRFCIASRVLCSVLADATQGQWDLAGAAQLLALDDWLGDTTLVQGVSAFPHATMLHKRGDALNWSHYWDYAYHPVTGASQGKFAHEAGQRFIQAVARQTEDADTVGIALSGGLDSRCLVAAAAEAGKTIHTYTWGAPRSYERTFARDTANVFGTVHHDCDYNVGDVANGYEEGIRTTEGFANCLDCHMLRHLELMNTGPTLFLDGYEGDLLMGGSYLRAAFLGAMPSAPLPDILFAWRNTLIPEAALTQALPQADTLGERAPSAMFVQLMEDTEALATPDRADRFFLENHARRSIIMGPVQLRSAYASGLSFFDYDLVDALLSVPAALRAEHRIYLEMMRRHLPRALRIRWSRTLLPAGAPEWLAVGSKAVLKACRMLEARIGWPDISARQSTVDFPAWLRQPLRPWMHAICNDPHPLADEILDPGFCQRTWNDHLAGNDRTRQLGAIATLRGFSLALARARTKTVPVTSNPAEVRRPQT